MARIGAAHGVRGQVRVKPFNEDPLALGTFGPLTTPDGRRLSIASLRPQKDMLIAAFEGVTTREAAQALNGAELYVERSAIPEPDEADDFLVCDLEGLAVLDPQGTGIGRVAAVVNYGAGDLLEIAPQGGGPRWLVTFERANVPYVDIAGGTVTVDRPPETDAGDRRTR